MTSLASSGRHRRGDAASVHTAGPRNSDATMPPARPAKASVPNPPAKKMTAYSPSACSRAIAALSPNTTMSTVTPTVSTNASTSTSRLAGVARNLRHSDRSTGPNPGPGRVRVPRPFSRTPAVIASLPSGPPARTRDPRRRP